MSKFDVMSGGKIIPESSWGHDWPLRLVPEGSGIFVDRSCWFGILVRKGERFWGKHSKRPKDEDVYIMQKDGELWANFTGRDPEVGDLIDVEDVRAYLQVEKIEGKSVVTINVRAMAGS